MLGSEGPLVRANVIVVVAPPTGDYQMPSRSEIKDTCKTRWRVVKLRWRLCWER